VVTKDLKTKQDKLGETVKNAANLPQAYLSSSCSLYTQAPERLQKDMAGTAFGNTISHLSSPPETAAKAVFVLHTDCYTTGHKATQTRAKAKCTMRPIVQRPPLTMFDPP
jgi:hypothetical protein